MNKQEFIVGRLAGSLKDTYIKLLEQGYQPADLQKFMTDVQKKPEQTQEPKPKNPSKMKPTTTTTPAIGSVEGKDDLKVENSYLADDEETQDQPSEDDYVMSPTGPVGSRTRVTQYGKVLGVFNSDEEAETFIQEHMKKEQFFPGVWIQDDHGGLTPTSITGTSDESYLSAQADADTFHPSNDLDLSYLEDK